MRGKAKCLSQGQCCSRTRQRNNQEQLLMGMSFFSIDEVRTAVKSAVDFYNNERPHMSLDWRTPAEAALCTGEMKKKWVSYREKAIKDLVA